jgi:S1-C subfamily serine protease
VGIAPGSPAARAGFEPGDVLIELDGAVADDVRRLQRALDRTRRAVLARVWRRGTLLYLALIP